MRDRLAKGFNWLLDKLGAALVALIVAALVTSGAFAALLAWGRNVLTTDVAAWKVLAAFLVVLVVATIGMAYARWRGWGRRDTLPTEFSLGEPTVVDLDGVKWEVHLHHYENGRASMIGPFCPRDGHHLGRRDPERGDVYKEPGNAAWWFVEGPATFVCPACDTEYSLEFDGYMAGVYAKVASLATRVAVQDA